MATATSSPVFTPKQQAVLDAIRQGASKTAAAQSAGIHRDTLYDWQRRTPGFHSALRAAEDDYRASLASQVRNLSALALDQLEDLMKDKATPASVRFRVSQFVLTRPQFPGKEWTLPENINEPIIREIQNAEKEAAYHSQLIETEEYWRQNPEAAGQMQDFYESGESDTSDTDTEFSVGLSESPATAPQKQQTPKKPVARNANCPCGSGKKYKRCCGTTAPALLNAARKSVVSLFKPNSAA